MRRSSVCSAAPTPAAGGARRAVAAFYRAITDYRTGKDIGLDEPKIEARLDLLPQSPEQEEFNKRLVMFARTGNPGYIGRSGMSDSEKKAKMLIATAYANKMAVDMRLLDHAFFCDHHGNKARSAAAQIAENYRNYNDHKATQLAFCDLGVFKPGQWNVYSEIKRLLVEEHGIPAEEIRFIQETKSAEAKSNLTDAVNAGIVRVVIGSRDILGTGINMQERICALHQIDIPWVPTKLEQSNGRGARPGNRMAKEVLDNKLSVHYYATENSLDAYKYHLVHMKANFINQVKSGTVSKRIIDEGGYDDTFGMNVLEFVALITGNNDLQEKAKLEKEIASMEGERKSFNASAANARQRLASERAGLEKSRSTVAEMQADLASFERSAPKAVDGTRPALLRVVGVKSADERPMAERLNEIAGSVKTNGEFQKVGQIGEFPVVVKTSTEVDKDGNHRSVNRFFVQGIGARQIKYNYNNGYIATDPALCCSNFTKAMERIPSLVAEYEQRIESSHKDIAILERMAGETWGRDAELAEKQGQLILLDKQIEKSLGKEEYYDLPMLRLNSSPEERAVVEARAEDITELYPEEETQGSKIRM